MFLGCGLRRGLGREEVLLDLGDLACVGVAAFRGADAVGEQCQGCGVPVAGFLGGAGGFQTRLQGFAALRCLVEPGFGVGEVLGELLALAVEFLQLCFVPLEGGFVGEQGVQCADSGAQVLCGGGELGGVEGGVLGRQEGTGVVFVGLGAGVLGCGGGRCGQERGHFVGLQGALALSVKVGVVLCLFVEGVELFACGAVGFLVGGEVAYGAFSVAESGQFLFRVGGGGGCFMLEGGGFGVQGSGPGEGGGGEGGGVGRLGCSVFGFECWSGLLLGAFGQAQDVGACLVALCGDGGFACCQPVLDGPEAVGVEELAEQVLAVGGAGAQEFGELVLWQEDDLAELLAAHAEQGFDLVRGFSVGPAERFPAALPGGVQGPFAEVGLGFLSGLAVAADFPFGLGGDPPDFQALPGEGDLECHLGQETGGRVVAAELEVAVDGRLTVESDADRSEQGALAGAGVAVEKEETVCGQGVEVDGVGAGEGAESLQVQGVQAHLDGFLLLGADTGGVDRFLEEAVLFVVGRGAAHGGDEVVGDVEVAPSAEPFAVGGGGGLGGDGGGEVLQVEGVGEALFEACHGFVGAGGVGEGDVQPGFGEGFVGRVGQQVFQTAGQTGQGQLEV